MRKYERGDIDRIEWLDYMAFREIEKINKSECETSQRTYLYIDLPIFDFPLLFSEKEPVATLPPLRALQAEFFNLSDPEALRDNPVENKHRKLTRSHRNGPLDRELKPNAKIRDELNVCFLFIHALDIFFLLTLIQKHIENPQILTNPTPHKRRKRPPLEIPLLPNP